MHGAHTGFTVDIGEQVGRAGQDVSIAKKFSVSGASSVTQDHIQQALRLMSTAIDQAANHLFYSEEGFPPGLEHGGCTLSLAVVGGHEESNFVVLANVGDSEVVVTSVEGKGIIAQTTPDDVTPGRLPSNVLSLSIDGQQPESYYPAALSYVKSQRGDPRCMLYTFSDVGDRNMFLQLLYENGFDATKSQLRVPVNEYTGINISGAKGHGKWALKRDLSIESYPLPGAICVQATCVVVAA